MFIKNKIFLIISLLVILNGFEFNFKKSINKFTPMKFELKINKKEILSSLNKNIFNTNKYISSIKQNNFITQSSDFDGINQLIFLFQLVNNLDEQEKLYNKIILKYPYIVKTTSFYIKKIAFNYNTLHKINFLVINQTKELIFTLNLHNKQLLFLYNFFIKNQQEEKK